MSIISPPEQVSTKDSTITSCRAEEDEPPSSTKTSKTHQNILSFATLIVSAVWGLVMCKLFQIIGMV